MYFTCDDVFLTTFVYQPAFSILQLKKNVKSLIMLSVGNQNEYIAPFFFHGILLSCIA